ncbi:CRISPR-associated protein Cas2 [Gallibacterium salpingitidis]|uniref:CRISPR-associated protein Cas2 n=1 Tax=Gallibacterium salpingitidis TaxID=505341 RepID=A0A1A7NTL7_9PAST|nr:CRISPR-associated protein Cas2 [Gallibacterium salpingitidis]OBW93008.1 CRISPR-associated protein Cas2 [Gallibacterium salpingitidis]
MRNYLISYDLYKSGQNYNKLISYIESYSVWAKIHQSVWYIKSNKSCDQIRNELLACVDYNDSLFVAEMNDAAWNNLSEGIDKYIYQNWAM